MRTWATLGAAIGVMAVFAAASSAVASDENIYYSITGPQLAAIVQNRGYKAQLSTDTGGDPMIESTANAEKFVIFFYGCNKESVRSCDSIQLNASWTNDIHLTPEDVNFCNQKYVFGKLTVDSNGVNLIMPAAVAGVTDAYFAKQLDKWELVLSEAEQCFADKKR
jgi:hypothetical protein